MSVEVLIANLLRVAKEDLDGARLLAGPGNRNAIYLCEQAAEKVIRAVLSSEGIHAGIKHQLQEMVDLVPDANPLKPLLRDIEYLTAYATSYRYPTAQGRIKMPPPSDAVATGIAKVQAALDEAARRFVVDVGRRDVPAGSAGPIR